MGRGSGTGRHVVETDRSSAMGLAGNGIHRSRQGPMVEAWQALPGPNLYENWRIMSVGRRWPRTASSNTMQCEPSEDNPGSLRQIEKSDQNRLTGIGNTSPRTHYEHCWVGPGLSKEARLARSIQSHVMKWLPRSGAHVREHFVTPATWQDSLSQGSAIAFGDRRLSCCIVTPAICLSRPFCHAFIPNATSNYAFTCVLSSSVELCCWEGTEQPTGSAVQIACERCMDSQVPTDF